MKKWVIGFLLFAVVGCQTTDIMDMSEVKPPCSERDWFELGRSDGTKGVPNLKWKDHAKGCSDFNEISHNSYISGWYTGVDQFCRPHHAYHYGRTGLEYYNVCPVSQEAAFKKAYQKGLQVHLFEKNNKKLNQEIRRLQTASNKEDELNRIEMLLEERTQNQKQISEIEDQMNSTIE